MRLKLRWKNKTKKTKMSAKSINKDKETTQYSKMFSSLFCAMSILALSILCLLNNLTLDLYSTVNLLMVVAPGACCFWISGFIIGKIFDKKQVVMVEKKKINEQKAYEIPSMFSDTADFSEDEFGSL